MMDHIKQPSFKEICGTCRHGGRIVGYKKYRKSNNVQNIKIFCEKLHKEVDITDVCLDYSNEKGEGFTNK